MLQIVFESRSDVWRLVPAGFWTLEIQVEGFKSASVNVTVYPGIYRVEGFKLHQLMLQCIQVYIE